MNFHLDLKETENEREIERERKRERERSGGSIRIYSGQALSVTDVFCGTAALAFAFQVPRAREVTERLFGKFALRTSVILDVSRYCLEAGTGENTSREWKNIRDHLGIRYRAVGHCHSPSLPMPGDPLYHCTLWELITLLITLPYMGDNTSRYAKSIRIPRPRCISSKNFWESDQSGLFRIFWSFGLGWLEMYSVTTHTLIFHP